MVSSVEMFGGVLVFGGIAAADMPALQAQAQVYPGITCFQTLLTTISARRNIAYLVKVCTLLCHRNLLYDIDRVFVWLSLGFPSISNNALRALARARPEAMNIATRKLVTNDSLIACCKTACDWLLTPDGICMPTSKVRWTSTSCSTGCGMEPLSVARWLSRLLLKTARTTSPSTAMAISPAVRDTALLMPEATPARCGPTDPITAVVSGATAIAMPRPSTTAAGKNVVQ